MATRSNIGILQDDGTIKAIYCHWDGYVEGVGLLLASYYDTYDKASELIALGDISSLKPTIQETQATSSGDEERKARNFKTVEEWREYASNQWAEYLYVYQPKPYGPRGYEWAYMEVEKYWKPIPTKLVQTA